MSSSFPVDLTAVLTGASIGQLGYWRRGNQLLVPEVSSRPARYSFRDLVALRTVVKLRRTQSLQAIRTAFENLREFDLTEHPSQYQLVAHGKSIVLVREAEAAMDLVKSPGDYLLLATMEDIFAQFDTRKGRRIVDFLTPRPHLEIRERRMGGWPTAENSRVPYDTIAALMATGEVSASEVQHYYPSVTPEAAVDAANFADEVAAVRRAA